MINSAEAPLDTDSVQRCEQLEREASGAVCVGLQRRDELLGVLCCAPDREGLLRELGGGRCRAVRKVRRPKRCTR